MVNLLFTCAGRRTYLLKYFKEQLNGEGLIVAADMQLSAPALSVADVKCRVPSVYDEGYIDAVLDLCEKHSISAVISLNDLELPILANNAARFSSIGTKLILSSPEVIETCFDKYQTSVFIESLGLLSPITVVGYQNAVKKIKEGILKFPLMLKPRWGSGSIGIEKVVDFEEFKEVYASLRRKIKRSILATASEGEDYILIQEYIDGQEFGMDVMNDLTGNIIGVVVKKKLAMRAGETDKAAIVEAPEVVEIGKRIGESLRHIGNLDCDVLEKDGRYYVLELNPRFGGGFPFTYEAGANYPKVLIELLKGNAADESLLKAEVGTTFAKCDCLVKV